MNGPLQSQHWYRVARLKPFLRTAAQLARHEYRGEPWYMMRDPVSGEYRRVNQTGYDLVKYLDGQQSLDEIYQRLLDELGERAPGQPEIIDAVSKLAAAGLLQTDIPTDLRILKHEADNHRSRLLKSRVNPLSFQIGVFDPTRMLKAMARLGTFLFSHIGAVLWLVLVAFAGATALAYSTELGAAVSNSQSNNRFLLLMWLVYPLLKLLHESAHGLAIRHYGGEVPEMGIRLLVLMPVPYVDGSASTLFSRKRERMIVAAAGIGTELAAAAIAVLLWVQVEPGLIREFLLTVIVIGSISTVFFNGNPLMKFDGYYVFSDLLELPNLAERSKRAFVSWFQRSVLRLRHIPRPHAAPGETPWLLSYAVSSWIYRAIVMSLIAMFIGHYSLIGSALVLGIGLWSLLISPAVNALSFLWISPDLNGRRTQTTAIAAGAGAVAMAIVLIPAPSSTIATGIVWLSDDAQIRAKVDGNIRQILLKDGQPIKRGQAVFELENPDIILREKQLVAELSALRTEQMNYLKSGSNKATLVRDQIVQKTKELADAKNQVAELTVTAKANGQFVLPDEDNLTGAWLDAGDVAGYVLGSESTLIRVAIPNRFADKVRNGTNFVSVQFADEPDMPWIGAIAGGPTAGSIYLPGPALSTEHGGPIQTKPDDARVATQPVFMIDVRVQNRNTSRARGRATVRFDHNDEALVTQIATAMRSLFLRQFNS